MDTMYSSIVDDADTVLDIEERGGIKRRPRGRFQSGRNLKPQHNHLSLPREIQDHCLESEERPDQQCNITLAVKSRM